MGREFLEKMRIEYEDLKTMNKRRVIFYMCDIAWIYMKLIPFILELKTILKAIKILLGALIFFLKNPKKKIESKTTIPYFSLYHINSSFKSSVIVVFGLIM